MSASLKKFQVTVIALGIPVGLIGIIVARSLLIGIFGPAFEEGIRPLQILLFSTMIIYFNIALANPLLAWGKEKEYLFIVGSGACVNIAFNIALIPVYGIIGAASATLAAEMTVLVVSLVRRYRLRNASFGSVS